MKDWDIENNRSIKSDGVMQPTISSKIEASKDCGGPVATVNERHAAVQLQPEFDGHVVIDCAVPCVESDIESKREVHPARIIFRDSEEASYEQADSVEGRWSSEDGMSVIDELDIPMDNDFSRKETKDVIRLKLLVMLILIASASTIAAWVFRYISRSETSQFESKFGYDSSKVIQTIGSSLERTLGLLDSFSVTMISYARDLNETWPFVTLPDFGVRMAKLLPLTDAFVVVVLPIIHSEKRKEWEEYAILHDDWVNESMAIQETWEGYYGPIIYDWEPHVAIHGDNGDIEGNVR
jgi:hypothetical protein